MKIKTESHLDPYTDKEYAFITYIVEEEKGDTERSICDYIEAKHGMVDREVILIDGRWGRTIRIVKTRQI